MSSEKQRIFPCRNTLYRNMTFVGATTPWKKSLSRVGGIFHSVEQ